MTLVLSTTNSTGMTIPVTAQRPSDGYWWNDTTGAWVASAPSYADKSIDLTEGTGDYIGYYSGSPSASMGSGIVDFWFHDTAASNIVVGHSLMVLVAGDTPSSTVGATEVIPELTHYCDGVTSDSIIEVNEGFAGTLALQPDIGDATIATVNSAALTGAASVTGTNLLKDRTQRQAMYTVATLSTTGTYTATVSVTTTDSQTLVSTGTIIVS